jgi:hypothetical protein
VFTSDDFARDTVRLARTYDVELVLLGLPPIEDALPDDLAEILHDSPADVALLAGQIDIARGDGVFVPFGGSDHDWAALELGAWLALATSAPLRLIGTTADPQRERRDASRLLADASLSVQRLVGVDTEPLLADPTEEALVAVVESATVVVVGISPRWRGGPSVPCAVRLSPARRRSCPPGSVRRSRTARKPDAVHLSIQDSSYA